jgi:hypothetical protein
MESYVLAKLQCAFILAGYGDVPTMESFSFLATHGTSNVGVQK